MLANKGGNRRFSYPLIYLQQYAIKHLHFGLKTISCRFLQDKRYNHLLVGQETQVPRLVTLKFKIIHEGVDGHPSSVYDQVSNMIQPEFSSATFVHLNANEY
jgi:hypothetical protein